VEGGGGLWTRRFVLIAVVQQIIWRGKTENGKKKREREKLMMIPKMRKTGLEITEETLLPSR